MRWKWNKSHLINVHGVFWLLSQATFVSARQSDGCSCTLGVRLAPRRLFLFGYLVGCWLVAWFGLVLGFFWSVGWVLMSVLGAMRKSGDAAWRVQQIDEWMKESIDYIVSCWLAGCLAVVRGTKHQILEFTDVAEVDMITAWAARISGPRKQNETINLPISSSQACRHPTRLMRSLARNAAAAIYSVLMMIWFDFWACKTRERELKIGS